MDDLRERLMAELDRLSADLRQLGLSPVMEDAPRGVGESPLGGGDHVEASPRLDVAFAARERLAARIARLAAALERVDSGTYGRCERCGGPIEHRRLAALPEAVTCLECQRAIERFAA